MKTTKAAIVLAALLGGSMIATSADAQHRHHHSRSSVGIYFGVPGPVYYPRYYYPPYYYYPPAVVAAPSAPVYIEQAPPAPAPAAAQGSAGFWYYCRDTQTYYPYVQQCASPWQQVVPNATPAS